MIFYTSNCLKV